MRISDWSSDVCSSDRDRADARGALGLPSSGRVVLYAGNLKPVKGCFDLLDSFASAPYMPADCRLAFVGDGPCRSALVRRRDEHGLGERGILAGSRPPSLLRSAEQTFELHSIIHISYS